MEQINEGSVFKLTKNDYDLRYYCYQNPEKLKNLDVEGILVPYFKMMPSFYSIYESRQKEDSYIPEKIVVLCSAKTFSGGYGLMWGLYKFGAVIIGTPSGQAGNSFTNMLEFTLKNSEIKGQVSSKSQWLFPDDLEKGRVLRPDIELSYDYLKKCKFDKNASVLLTLEKLDANNPILR